LLEAFFLFQTKTRNVFPSAVKFVNGLLRSERGNRNIERICETLPDDNYSKLQHFISESPWDAFAVMEKVAKDTDALLKEFDSVGLLIDESGEEKKGDCSVGVAPQYCGSKGKIANCQVAVFGCLAADKYANLIDARLYLPESWTSDKKRCKGAGVPKERLKFKKKTELALEIVRAQRKAGIRFDFVGADAFYGNDSWFLKELDKDGELFVIDVHKDQPVYLEKPVIAVPEKQGNKGRTPTLLKADIEAVEIGKYYEKLRSKDWKKVKLRDGAKGELISQVHVRKVFTWNKEDQDPCQRLLIIRKTKKGKKSEIKYALSNAQEGKFTIEELVRMQSQRFWIENSLKESKQQIGMYEYQVRGWLAWHHHIALSLMATSFMLGERLLHRDKLPLLSCRDVRDTLLQNYASATISDEQFMNIMKKRHERRKKDIARNSTNSTG
jgi:SRSO17 transposase